MVLLAQILGIWMALALIAGALIGRAISEAPPPPPWRPALPRSRAVPSAAAGSALAAIAMFSVLVSMLNADPGGGPAGRPAPPSHYVAAVPPGAVGPGPTGLQDPGGGGPGAPAGREAAPAPAASAASGPAPTTTAA